MKKRHISGFFDELVRTPAFLFLCAMFLCGALAGGLTGLIASEGDDAVLLAGLLSALPEQTLRSVLGAVIWIALPLVCALLRPTALFLSALCAARGYALALTVAVALGQGNGLGLSLLTTGLPAVLSVPALLSACTMVWCAAAPVAAGRARALPRDGRAPYAVCIGLAALSALLRVLLAFFFAAK